MIISKQVKFLIILTTIMLMMNIQKSNNKNIKETYTYLCIK